MNNTTGEHKTTPATAPRKPSRSEVDRQSAGTGLEALGSGLSAIGSGLETIGSGIYAVWQGWFSKDEQLREAQIRAAESSSLKSPDDVRTTSAHSMDDEAEAEKAREAAALAHLNQQARVRVIDPHDDTLLSARRRR